MFIFNSNSRDVKILHLHVQIKYGTTEQQKGMITMTFRSIISALRWTETTLRSRNRTLHHRPWHGVNIKALLSVRASPS